MATIFLGQYKYGMDWRKVHQALTQMAQKTAIDALVAAAHADFTDNSGGTANQAVEAVTVPSPFTVTGTDAAPKAGFDTALGTYNNAYAVIADTLNDVLPIVGLPTITDNTGGTVAIADTIAVVTTALTAVDGTGSNALDEVTGRARIQTLINNGSTCLRVLNAMSQAVGATTLADNSGGSPDVGNTWALEAAAASGAGVDGTALSTLSDTAVDAALAAIANNIAEIADHFNTIINVATAPNVTVVASA